MKCRTVSRRIEVRLGTEGAALRAAVVKLVGEGLGHLRWNYESTKAPPLGRMAWAKRRLECRMSNVECGQKTP